MIEFLTEKRFTLSSHLIQVAISLHLSLTEFLLLMYFEDATDKTFDVVKICKILALQEQDVLSAFNKLLTLNLIKMEPSKDETNRHCEIISLVPMYNAIVEKKSKKADESKKQDIFDTFQKELGRSISPMEYEIINAWMEKGFSCELILAALKEAIFNGVSSLRYIDKILYEWHKKGYQSPSDVEKNLRNKKEEKETLELFDYNWLDED